VKLKCNGGRYSSSENNIKMDLKDIVCEGVDWIHLAQNSEQWRSFMDTLLDGMF
jgi:hypothetical protein